MYSVRHHPKGHIFFEEGSPGPLAYIIKSGQVEITKKQGNKEISIAMLGPGEIFGEMALLGSKARTATARALANTEVVSISQARLLSFFRRSDPILKHVVMSLINRLEMATALITQDKMDDIYASACQIIVLVANQESTPTDENGKRLLPYTSVIEQLRGILSIDAADCHLILEKLEAINLIAIVQTQFAKDKSIRLIDEENFVQRAQRVSKELEGAWSDRASQGSIYLDLYDLSEQTGVEREKIYKKIGTGEVPEEFLFFKKEDILKWVEEVGQAFFDKKKRITVDDLDSIESIPYVKNSILQVALRKLDFYQVCQLLKTADESIREKIFANLSGRFKQIAQQELKLIEEVDAAEVEETIEDLLDEIRKLMEAEKTKTDEDK